MAIPKVFILLVFLAMRSFVAFASDSSQLQDFCVADLTSQFDVNGFVCKDAKKVAPDDFFFTGLHKPKSSVEDLGSFSTNPVSVQQIPGLNALGIAVTRLDFGPYGLNPPHLHPRASEVLVMLRDSLFVGFIASSSDNQLFAKELRAGDVFVFPQALIHFQFNNSTKKATALSGLSSQNPGVASVPKALFGSSPPILVDILTEAFLH